MDTATMGILGAGANESAGELPCANLGGLPNPEPKTPACSDSRTYATGPTAAQVDEVVKAVANPMSVSLARKLANIPKTTFWGWRRAGAIERERRAAGEDPDPNRDTHVALDEGIERAQAQGAARRLAWIDAGAVGADAQAEYDTRGGRFVLEYQNELTPGDLGESQALNEAAAAVAQSQADADEAHARAESESAARIAAEIERDELAKELADAKARLGE